MIRTLLPADMSGVLDLVIASGMFAHDDVDEIKSGGCLL